jgi:hypothetical protein
MRCFTILLVLGWFLLIPPFRDGRELGDSGNDWNVRDTKQPLSRWTHERSFDTAEACEAYKREQVGRYGQLAKEYGEQGKEYEVLKSINIRLMIGVSIGRCIPTEMLGNQQRQ